MTAEDLSPAAVNCVRANLTLLAKPGRYLIEVAGVTLESRYPINRMAKALALAGITGKLEVYGPSADGARGILRITVDIEELARHRWSEGKDGIRMRPWDDKSLASLKIAAAKLSAALKDAKAKATHTKGNKQ